MIEHIFIKNFRAFERENIPLDKHTLLIGTNQSGKTTVLDALNLFFNGVMDQSFVRNKKKDVVIEIHVDEQRYRKTYSPPMYKVNFKKCIGNMYDIHHIRYLHVPTDIDNPSLLNDILSINLSKRMTPEEQIRVYKVSDYIDGVIGNSNYQLFEYRPIVKMNINDDVVFSKDEYATILSNITYQYLVLGMDNPEQNVDADALQDITKYTYQTIFTTTNQMVVSHHQGYVSALYKGNQSEDFDTIKKRLESKQDITYVLVEGKYDVNWFETAIKLLEKENQYIVIPCGGHGNISFVSQQLQKEGYQTIIITDGDTKGAHALRRDIIELYADPDYVNQRFHTDFMQMPSTKSGLFRAIREKDDVVKNVLSRWAKKHLTIDHPFVQEVARHLTEV